MLLNVIYTEFLKYKRTALPWIVILGGLFPAIVGIMIDANSGAASWNTSLKASLDYMDLLVLLLAAVAAGYVFAEEYRLRTAGILFNYPVSRTVLYLTKVFVLLFSVSVMYLLFPVYVLALGAAVYKSLPPAGLFRDFIGIAAMAALFNFVPLPLTSLAASVGKGMAAAVGAGMCYVIVSLTFSASVNSIFIPFCLPNTAVLEFFNGGIGSDHLRSMAITAVTAFAAAFAASMLYYCKSDVYS